MRDISPATRLRQGAALLVGAVLAAVVLRLADAGFHWVPLMVGIAYLLGALTDLERQAFERHIATCGLCRDELERLRPAANALPRSVEQLAPPPSLKASLMEVVEREASESESEPAHPARGAPFWRRLAPSGSWLRPALVAGASSSIRVMSAGRSARAARWPDVVTTATAPARSAMSASRAGGWSRSNGR